MDINAISKAVASIAVCGLGAVSMCWTGDDIGIGWAMLGIFLIWAC